MDHLKPLARVPADCKSLTVDENFAPFVGDYLEQLAGLQHLAIAYEDHSTDRETPGKDPLKMLNKLSHLTHLRSLKVVSPGHPGLAGLHEFPTSLTSLYIGEEGKEDTIIGLPDPNPRWRRESECLRCLTALEFRFCCVHIAVGSIAMLQGLTSLSLHGSEVGRGLDAVLKLTNLVYLDLTGATIPEGLSPEERQAWSSFEAWPALCVFKFAGCWSIHNSTVLDIATVQEVHTGRLVLGMETANVHLVLRHNHVVMSGSLASLLSPAWSTHIVDLRVMLTDPALHLAAVVTQVLEALLCLQSFQLLGGYDEHSRRHSPDIDPGQGRIVLGHGYSGQLKDLKLQNIYCSTLDFGLATCLTSISLNIIEMQHVSCELMLPSSVVRLEYFGNSLITKHAKRLLEGLPSLAHITLGFKQYGFQWEQSPNSSTCVPTMPSSLCWMSVTSTSLKELLNESAQECLKYCTGLEYLILPPRSYPKGELHAWVKGARYF